jgi:hypothetical protein
LKNIEAQLMRFVYKHITNIILNKLEQENEILLKNSSPTFYFIRPSLPQDRF